VLKWNKPTFEIGLSKDWLSRNPLTETALENEAMEWKSVGMKLEVACTLP